LKGASARRLFSAHPDLKKKLWGGNLWNPSYFVATVSEQTRAQIQKYIEGQHVATEGV
jgi:putative transposase